MDLASLSFSIDSSQAIQAKDNLDKMKGASVDATEQALRLTRAFLDGKDPLATYRAELALMDSNLRNTGVGIDALVDRVRLMGAAMSGAAGPTKEFSQAMGQLQAAAAMFDTSTRSLEMFVRTTRDLGVSSQEMVSGLQRIQAALQGIGVEGQRAREVLRNYGVNMEGRGPNDSAAVYRDFVERARTYRMDSGTYDDYRAVVGNVSIQGFAGLRDPGFRSTAQIQREIDASAQAARIAELREGTFAIGRGTNRFESELGDLESEYSTFRDRRRIGFLTSPETRRAELEARRAAGMISNTDYYRNRMDPGQGFASNYLDDLNRPMIENPYLRGAVSGALPGFGLIQPLMGLAERARLGGEWRSSSEYDENIQRIDSIYRDQVARRGWSSALPFFGSASRERANSRMLNDMRMYQPPAVEDFQPVADRLPAYRATTSAMDAMRYEAGDGLMQRRRRLVLDAIQRLNIQVPNAEMLPLDALEGYVEQFDNTNHRFGMEAINARSLRFDQREADGLLEIEPYTTGVTNPFARRARQRELARYGASGEGISSIGWQNSSSEASANRSVEVARIIAETEGRIADATDRTRVIKERVAELDRGAADRLGQQIAQQERLSAQTGRRMNAFGNFDLSDSNGLAVQMRLLAAQDQSDNAPGPAQPPPGFFLQAAADNEMNRLANSRLQRRIALGRTDEILGMRESGMTDFEVGQRTQINDEVRDLERLEKALAETVGVQSAKRLEVLQTLRETRQELEKIQQSEARQLAQDANSSNRARSVVLQDDIIRMQSMRLNNNLGQMAQEDAALALARPRYGNQISGLSAPQAIRFLQNEGVWDGYQDLAFANQAGQNERIFPMLEGQIGLAQAGRSTIPAIARAQMQRAQLAMIPLQFPGNEPLQNEYRRLYQESFNTQNFLAAQSPVDASELAANRAYDQRSRLDGGANTARARVEADLAAAMVQYERSAGPAEQERYLNAEIMRRVEEGLLGIAEAAAGAKESLNALEATRGMTPAEQRFYMATQANPAIQGLETLRDRYEPGTERFNEIQQQIDQARSRAGQTEADRNRAQFLQGERPLNNQLQDAEFLADGWWMSGARREREVARRRAERDLRGTPGLSEEEIDRRINEVERLAGYSEIARQNQLIRDSFLQVGNAAGTALDQIILKGGNARQVMAALLASLASSAIRLGTNRLFEFGLDALGAGIRGATASSGGAAAGASSGGGFFDFLGTLFRAGASASAPVPAAQGHAFGPGGIYPMAQGGSLIRSPTYIPMANGGTALGGEAGPEAILPLGRDSSGRLGVIGGGGATNNFNVTVNMQGSSGNAAQDAKAADMMGKMVRAELEKMMTEKMQKQMQPGGMFAGGGAPVYG